ncbi:hypothetical protein PsorP6_000751 [Peronosclerospora sorghi]|uniref:Uncharacterized protein n=1 Tax=Peronosclerospora sorghi TaxID=230839 RepID=A0ACC0WSJ8_9STRA|nr:hypothetical protein PsorP6_000751 [Peronosclerospora sorghi]
MGANMLEVGTNQEDGTWHDYAHAALQKEQQESEAIGKAHARSIQESAEKTTRSLKEMAETLEIAREKLTEAEARPVCANEEDDAAFKALGEMKSQSETQSTKVEKLQKWIQPLQSELQELQTQRESDAKTA